MTGARLGNLAYWMNQHILRALQRLLRRVRVRVRVRVKGLGPPISEGSIRVRVESLGPPISEGSISPPPDTAIVS